MDAVLSTIISSWGLTVIMAVISLFLGSKVVKYKNFIKEVLEVGIKYRQITRDGSPGGKRMTKEEKDDFVEEIIEALQAAGALIKAKNK